jgi:hypothetical protein
MIDGITGPQDPAKQDADQRRPVILMRLREVGISPVKSGRLYLATNTN